MNTESARQPDVEVLQLLDQYRPEIVKNWRPHEARSV